MADRPAFIWDSANLRYRDTKGRFVAPTRVREAVDAVAGGAADELESLSRQLVGGTIDLMTWHRRAERVVRLSHLATGMVAKGGRPQMTPSDYGRVGAGIKFQYGFLYQFARQIEAGEVTESELIRRARMYGSSSVGAFESVRRSVMKDGGYSQERRHLDSNHSCDSCISYSSMGWVPIGTLPGVGQECECKSSCHCHFAYRMRSA